MNENFYCPSCCKHKDLLEKSNHRKGNGYICKTCLNNRKPKRDDIG